MSDMERLAENVLSTLRIADGDDLVFGRVLDLDDAMIGRLVRRHAEDLGLHPTAVPLSA